MNLEILLRRWRRGQFLAIVLRSLGLALGIGALSWVVLPAGPERWLLVVLVALATAVATIWLPRPPMANRELMASHLDRQVPELEDSTDLLIREDWYSTSLERLQVGRVQSALSALSEKEFWPRSQVLDSLRLLLGGGLVALLVFVGQGRWADHAAKVGRAQTKAGAASSEGVDPFQRVEIEIQPPAYMGTPAFHQRSLDIEAAQGAKIRWLYPAEVENAYLDFTGQESSDQSSVQDGNLIELVAHESRVYQLVLNTGEAEVRSAYSRLTVIPDESPRLRIVRPQERVTTVSGPSTPLELAVEAEDDHGLARVELVFTLARGSGEMVEFRQHRQRLQPDPTGAKASLETRLDFQNLGLGAGSELYVFAEARDNREPDANVGRSGTYIVRYPAEKTLSADLGEALPIVLPPEYFRSQRQIIMDTEKLIAEQQEIGAEEFQSRSADLGFDQRALRMRYGTLLGEEFESGRPVDAGEEDHDHQDGSEDGESGPVAGEGNLAGVPTEFVHFHDSAEIATFFDSEIRTQLKQVLAQMWDAEGRLRVHQPQEALPFEYAALELLKDLQQRSRIYVQKVGFETPPLEPDKIRFTGELDDIPTRSRAVKPTGDDVLAKSAMRLLEGIRGGVERDAEMEDEAGLLLRSAIAQRARTEPKALLGLTALDRWLAGDNLTADERHALEETLWHFVSDPVPRPRRGRIASDPLSEMYRAVLSEGVDP